MTASHHGAGLWHFVTVSLASWGIARFGLGDIWTISRFRDDVSFPRTDFDFEIPGSFWDLFQLLHRCDLQP